MSYIDKNKLLNSITEKDIEMILQNLSNYKYKKDSNHNFLTNTALCHGGDSLWKLIIYPNLNTNKFPLCACMTCGDKYDIIQFVIRAFRSQGKSMNWHKALQWIAVTLGRLDDVSIEDASAKIKKVDDFSWINRIKSAINKDESVTKETKEVNENVLDLFSYTPHEAWLNDGCSIEALDRFEIGYYSQQDCISIPHRDENEKLIGVRGRNLDPHILETAGKYLPLKINGHWLKHALGEHLYGLWVIKDYVKKIGKIMLVEAEKSCVQAYTMFGDESYAAACCGSSITLTQVNICLNLGISKLIYAPDRDYHDPHSYEAEAWFNKQVLKLEPFLLYCQVYLIADTKDRLRYKDSPTDRGLETFLSLYDEKIEITMEDVVRAKESGGEKL